MKVFKDPERLEVFSSTIHKDNSARAGDLFYTLCCERLMKEHWIIAMIPNRFGESIAAIPALNIPLPMVDQFCDGILETFSHLSESSNLSCLGSVAKSAQKLR